MPCCRYEAHYGLPLGRKKSKKDVEPSEDDVVTKTKSNHIQRKLEARRKDNKSKVDSHVEEQFLTGRLYGTYVFVEKEGCIVFIYHVFPLLIF